VTSVRISAPQTSLLPSDSLAGQTSALVAARIVEFAVSQRTGYGATVLIRGAGTGVGDSIAIERIYDDGRGIWIGSRCWTLWESHDATESRQRQEDNTRYEGSQLQHSAKQKVYGANLVRRDAFSQTLRTASGTVLWEVLELIFDLKAGRTISAFCSPRKPVKFSRLLLPGVVSCHPADNPGVSSASGDLCFREWISRSSRATLSPQPVCAS
jgi:hypothetical protein